MWDDTYSNKFFEESTQFSSLMSRLTQILESTTYTIFVQSNHNCHRKFILFLRQSRSYFETCYTQFPIIFSWNGCLFLMCRFLLDLLFHLCRKHIISAL